MIDIQKELNEEQYLAAIDTTGSVIVSAGAGSGKTRMLTHRIAHLIYDKNVSAYNILAITFTNKAAHEMKDRIGKLVGGNYGVWVSTFHSMCARILRQHIELVGYAKNFTIYADAEIDRVLKAIIKEKKYDNDGLLKVAKNFISIAKNKGISAEECDQMDGDFANYDLCCEIYAEYASQLKKNNALDFDDLLSVTFDLLYNHKEIRDYYTNKFKYIHVDEFQDTNVIQYNLVKILSGENSKVFVVGDEDQSIYGWRGADVTNIANFVKDFDAKIYKLERNYRSTKNILDSANKLILNNVSRIKKTLWTDSGSGFPVKVFKAHSDVDEADYVVSNINKMLNQGCNPSDFAILMRVNALTRTLEQRLMQYNIPYKVYGGFKFFDRKEVKDILAYLKVLSNRVDNDSLLRIINFPKRGISDGTCSKLLEYAKENNLQLVDVVLGISQNDTLKKAVINKVTPFAELLARLYEAKEDMSVFELSEYLIKEIGLREHYEEKSEENHSRLLNIDDFLAGVSDFTKNKFGTLAEYLEEVTLYSEDDDTSGDAVFLSTIHSAKGMEYKVVFVVGVEEGLFPVSRANNSEAELEEERRLMYVAITRAKELLHITCSASRFMYGARKMQIPSRFFAEIDPNLVDSMGIYVVKNAPIKSQYSSGMNVNKVITSAQPPKVNNNIKDYAVGDKVKHRKFGVGTIINIVNVDENAYATIDFEKIGNIKLALKVAPIEKVIE